MVPPHEDVEGGSKQVEMVIEQRIYQGLVDKIEREIIDNEAPVLLYGPQSVGKSYLAREFILKQF
jgi:sigma54-dependent transcription regulator